MKPHRIQTSSFSLQRENQSKVQVISVSSHLGDDEFPRTEKQCEHCARFIVTRQTTELHEVG